MDGDRFISTTKNSDLRNNFTEKDNNFFAQRDYINTGSISQTEPIRHLNDYDSNILKEDAYKEVDDEIFKLEYKISRIEEEIGELDKKIRTAMDIHDYYLADTLKTRKMQLKEDLDVLTYKYNEASLSAKISSGLTSKIRDNLTSAASKFVSMGEFFISKIPGKISSIFEIRDSLNKLESINKNVDELMKSRYPYGEASEKYEQLSRYIARANSIQSEIYKFIK